MNLPPETYSSPALEGSFLDWQVFNPAYLFNHLYDIVNYIFSQKMLNNLYAIASVFSLFFVAVLIYTAIRMFEIRKKEHMHLHHEMEEYIRNQEMREKATKTEVVFKNGKWKKVLEYLFSVNANDWKLAVIEADLMLEELVTQLGFKGDGLGEKLKTADRESFKRLSDAWEVHNIRNKIAHEGSAFDFSLHEAKRVIALYEKIFTEFGYI